MFTVVEERYINGGVFYTKDLASFSDKKDAKKLRKKLKDLQNCVDDAEVTSSFKVVETPLDEQYHPVVIFQQIVRKSTKTGQWVPSTVNDEYTVQSCINLKEAKKMHLVGTGPDSKTNKNVGFIWKKKSYPSKKSMKMNKLFLRRNVNDATKVLIIGIFDNPNKLAKAYKKVMTQKFSNPS